MRFVSILLLLVFPLSLRGQVFSKKFPPTAHRRVIVLEILASGIKSIEKQGYFEDYVNEAIYWYSRGDKEILLPLLQAKVDGCTSDDLGSFLGEELQKRPGGLLKELSAFSSIIQHHAASHGVAADGSGWPPETMKHIRSILRKQAKSSDLSIQKAAKIWVSELDKFEKSQNEAQ